MRKLAGLRAGRLFNGENSLMKITMISLAVAALLACFQPLSAQYGRQTSSYPFSHKIHVLQEEIACMDCHSGVEKSISGLDDLLPQQAVCMDCHESSEITDPAQLPRIDRYSEKFSHQQHRGAGEECQSCHEEVAGREKFSGYILPNMDNCMSCHEIKAVSNACGTCHTPLEDLVPVSHRPDFTHRHSDLARLAANQISGNKDCASCHQPQFCQDCHEGDNLDRFTHPLNFEFTHSLEAQGKEKDCATCHTERQFCIDCHRDNQVLPRNHTVGWTNTFPNDGGRHRIEAMNDLDACISCHEQDAQQICQSCHGQ